jgi:hypothetical protein
MFVDKHNPHKVTAENYVFLVMYYLAGLAQPLQGLGHGLDKIRNLWFTLWQGEEMFYSPEFPDCLLNPRYLPFIM